MSTTEKTRVKTAYVVLRRSQRALAGTDATNQNNGAWEDVATIEANNATEAIRTAAKKQEGEYVAIPARSFSPVKVTVETKTLVKLA